MLPTLCIENPLWTQFLTLSLEGQKIDLKHKIQKGLNLMESKKRGGFYTLCMMGPIWIFQLIFMWIRMYYYYCILQKPREAFQWHFYKSFACRI